MLPNVAVGYAHHVCKVAVKSGKTILIMLIHAHEQILIHAHEQHFGWYFAPTPHPPPPNSRLVICNFVRTAGV